MGYITFDQRLLTISNVRMQHEETATGKLLVKMTPYLPSGGVVKQQRAAMLFAYIRLLEDKVDGGYHPIQGRDVLARELDHIRSFQAGNPFVIDKTFPEAELLPESLRGLPDKISTGILGLIGNIAGGIYTDSEAIVQGKTLPPQVERARHLSQSMAGFEVLSQLFYGKGLETRDTKGVEDLFIAWIIYDSLMDIHDDMSAGLILYSQKWLDQHNVRLDKKKIVPPEMSKLYESKKKSIIHDLPWLAWRAHDTNLPKPMAWALWFYISSRTKKLRKSSYPTRKMIFGSNSLE